MSVGLIYAVLCQVMIRRFVRALETKRFGRDSAGYTQHLDDRLIQRQPQEFLINHDIPTSSHVRLGMIRIGKIYLPLIFNCDSFNPSFHAIFWPKIR